MKRIGILFGLCVAMLAGMGSAMALPIVQPASQPPPSIIAILIGLVQRLLG